MDLFPIISFIYLFIYFVIQLFTCLFIYLSNSLLIIYSIIYIVIDLFLFILWTHYFFLRKNSRFIRFSSNIHNQSGRFSSPKFFAKNSRSKSWKNFNSKKWKNFFANFILYKITCYFGIFYYFSGDYWMTESNIHLHSISLLRIWDGQGDEKWRSFESTPCVQTTGTERRDSPTFCWVD